MKTTSKILSILLALVMVLSLATVTFAAEDAEVATLVKDVSELKAGDRIVIVGTADEVAYYALGATQNKNNRKAVAATVSNDTVTVSSDMQKITLENGKKDNTLAFNVGNGYLYAATGGNYLRTQETLSDDSSWKIEIAEDGIATIKAQGTSTKNSLQFNLNKNNVDPLFSCYASTQKDCKIYKLPTCKHADADKIYTKDENGHSSICSCGDESTKVEAKHSYVNHKCVCGWIEPGLSAKEIVDVAYALEKGASIQYEVSLTGVVSEIVTAYDSGYSNITVNITVEGKTIQCFRMKGTGADAIKVDDRITVTGTIINYDGTVEFNAGCTFVPATEVKPDDPKDPAKTGDATALVAISAAMLLAATGVVAVVSNKKHF